MKNKTTLVASAVGVAAVFLLLVGVNYLGGFAKQRVDLTADRTFTLSKGTRDILAKLDTPVQVRFYATRDENVMPVFLQTYARRVEDLLAEYQQVSKGKIQVQRLDPQPDSDAEDSARLDGVEGQLQMAGDPIYLGLSVTMLDQKQAIPALAPERERQLEYDISRAIAAVIAPKKPVVGVMSSLPVAGMMNPMMMQMGGRGQPPWVLYNELKRSFDVREVDMNAAEIPADVSVLLLIHPKTLSETAEYALDQFVLRGGKLVAFVDPLCILDSAPQGGMMGAPPSSSTLDRLFKAWGVTFATDKVIADASFAGQSRRGKEPTWLMLNETAFNADDIVTADMNNAMFIHSGAFEGTPAEGLKKMALIESSDLAQEVESFAAQMSGAEIAARFKPDGKRHAFAVRLTGKFKTAFPDGKPQAPAAEGEKKEAPKPAEAGLKESKAENTVILFGDADFIQDPVAVQEIENPLSNQRLAVPANGNLNLAQSAVEQMSGDENLIALRSRSVKQRPFLVVRALQERAEETFRAKIQSLETDLQETQAKLSDLQRSKNGDQRFILSPEQQKELEEFRKKEAQARKDLKLLRRNLRAEIDSLESRLKWVNIGAVPLAVAAAGIAFGIVKRKKAAAK